jgi:hypothetical protein
MHGETQRDPRGGLPPRRPSAPLALPEGRKAIPKVLLMIVHSRPASKREATREELLFCSSCSDKARPLEHAGPRRPMAPYSGPRAARPAPDHQRNLANRPGLYAYPSRPKCG